MYQFNTLTPTANLTNIHNVQHQFVSPLCMNDAFICVAQILHHSAAPRCCLYSVVLIIVLFYTVSRRGLV